MVSVSAVAYDSPTAAAVDTRSSAAPCAGRESYSITSLLLLMKRMFVCLPWSEVCSARVTNLLLFVLLLMKIKKARHSEERASKPTMDKQFHKRRAGQAPHSALKRKGKKLTLHTSSSSAPAEHYTTKQGMQQYCTATCKRHWTLSRALSHPRPTPKLVGGCSISD